MNEPTATDFAAMMSAAAAEVSATDPDEKAQAHADVMRRAEQLLAGLPAPAALIAAAAASGMGLAFHIARVTGVNFSDYVWRTEADVWLNKDQSKKD